MVAGPARASTASSAKVVSAVYVICSLAAGCVVIGLHRQFATALDIPDAIALLSLRRR